MCCQDKWDKAAMETAEAYAKLSHCNRRKVGATITSPDHRVLMVGYNGASKNMPNPCEGPDGLTYDYIHHAEANAIGYCAKTGTKIEGCSIYITTSPCIQCAKLIELSGITNVFYKEAYKDLSGVAYLEKVGISVQQMEEK